MKVVHVNYTDIRGGAARAAYRIHRALHRSGIDSRMQVIRRFTGDWTVQTSGGEWSGRVAGVRSLLGRSLVKALQTENKIPHWAAILPSRWPQRLNRSGADVTNLHWVSEEMMSVADIGRLQGPIVWTLHDMWAFCGAEHYTEDFRFRDGYLRSNRPRYESGLDLNRWTWQRKLRHWRRPMHIVTPSHWMADCAVSSPIMRGWPISVIPYAIDTDMWRPIDKALARKILGLPNDCRMLLFGAIGGTNDPRKGFDFLKAALDQLRGEIAGLELIILGQSAPRVPLDFGFPSHFADHLHDDVSLCLYYSAADALVLPSRQDNLPNVGLEAQACGTPTVAFDACGLPDIVEHRKTGYLAKPFEIEDLANGIRWVLDGDERLAKLSAQSREAAVTKFSYPVIAQQYQRLYENICKS